MRPSLIREEGFRRRNNAPIKFWWTSIESVSVETLFLSSLMSKRSMKRSLRKPNWDYGQSASYLITICLKRGSSLFGVVKDGRVELNESGKRALKMLLEIPTHCPNVKMDAHVVMPDHLHFILHFYRIDTTISSGRFAPVKKNLGSVIRGYKAGVTSVLKDDFPGFKWQERYDDQILFSSAAIDKAREYIHFNPRKMK